MSTVTPKAEARMATAVPAVPPKGEGWVLFAAIMFMVAACLNVIWGIAAVSDSTFFVGNAKYIISSLNTWGWIMIGWGALQFIAALSIARGGAFGRWFGIFAAGVSILIWMMAIPAYPFWSLTVVALDVLIIYGLAAYGGRPGLTA